MPQNLVVMIPTKGRPHTIPEVAEAFADTCTADTRVLLILDDEDPNLSEYKRQAAANHLDFAIQGGHNLITGLNFGYRMVPDDTFAIGFMGDDHRPRTTGWDKAYLDALTELGTGIVYGDDLLRGEDTPTQVAMTADIPRAVGFYAPPSVVHLYCDIYWRDLGREAGCIRYLPEVVIEHMHPAAGKAEWDAGHLFVNRLEMYVSDHLAYDTFKAAGGLQAAVDAVKRLGEW